MRGIAVIVALCCVACSGGGSPRAVPNALPAPPTTIVASRSTTTTKPPSITGSFVATATVAHLDVFDQPNASTPTRVLDNPWLLVPGNRATAVPQVFLVTQQRANGWVKVLLPVRPNGSTGWLRGGDVSVKPNSYRVRVALGTHQITVTNGRSVVYQGPVATGLPATPTPKGHYYLRVLVKAPDPNTVYGPYAYGLSSHSDALASFDGGDAEIGIHGNNDASGTRARREPRLHPHGQPSHHTARVPAPARNTRRRRCLAGAGVHLGSNQSHCHGVIVSNGPANSTPSAATASGNVERAARRARRR